MADGTTTRRRDYISDTAEVANAHGEHAWQARPVLAWLLRCAVWLTPLLVAAGVTVVLRAWVVAPLVDGAPTAAVVGAYAVLVAVTACAAWAAERAARRFLPLVALLRLSMLFPDQAPSRYKVLRSLGNRAALEDLAHAGGERGEAVERMLVLVDRLGAHEKHTRGHSERVRVYADLIGEQLRLEPGERDRLRLAALVHDVGKVSVPAELLRKAGRPSDEEWAQLQEHPDQGVVLAAGVLGWLGEWAGAISEHHERFDGTGYPRRLGGEDISLAGRIVAVADAFETMTSARSYKRPMTVRAARAELARCAGTHFDPMVVRALLDISLPRLVHRTVMSGMLVHLPILGGLQAVGSRVVSGLPGAGSGAAGTAGSLGAGTSVVGPAVAALIATGVAAGVVPLTTSSPAVAPTTAAVQQGASSQQAGLGPGAAGLAGALAGGSVGSVGPAGSTVASGPTATTGGPAGAWDMGTLAAGAPQGAGAFRLGTPGTGTTSATTAAGSGGTSTDSAGAGAPTAPGSFDTSGTSTSGTSGSTSDTSGSSGSGSGTSGSTSGSTSGTSGSTSGTSGSTSGTSGSTSGTSGSTSGTSGSTSGTSGSTSGTSGDTSGSSGGGLLGGLLGGVVDGVTDTVGGLGSTLGL